MLGPALALSSACLLLMPVAARAQDADRAREIATSRALFERGLALADADRWAEAADSFARASDLHEASPISLNLGLALLQLNRLVEATESFRRVIRAREATDRHRRQAQQQLNRTLPRLATLHVEVDGVVEGDEVALDGNVLPGSMWGAPIPADPGRHQVTVSRAGAPVASEEIELAEGASATIAVTAPAAPTPSHVAREAAGRSLDRAPPDLSAPEPSGNDDGWILGLAVGAGAAVAIAAAIAIIVATSSGPNMDLSCAELSLGCVEIMP